MSVPGEFQRVLADLVSLLRRSEVDGASELARGLADAGVRGREELSGGAARVVDLLEPGEAQPAPPALETPELVDQAAHLRAICRAILGR